MNKDYQKAINNLLTSWKFVVKRAKEENGITEPWNEHQNSYIHGLQKAIDDLQGFYDAIVNSCEYDEYGEGTTAPDCLLAGEHVEGCQYYGKD